MIQMTVQSIKEHEAESLSAIESSTLTDIKGIIGAVSFTNNEKIHLIESRLIIEKSERSELAAEMNDLRKLEAIIQSTVGREKPGDSDAPYGQLTIFDFLGTETEEDPSEKDVPEEIQVAVKEFMGFLQATFGK
ncbi:hypothetical protein [Metabacillus sp. SLBN-84]